MSDCEGTNAADLSTTGSSALVSDPAPASVTTEASSSRADSWTAKTLESKLLSYEGLECFAKIRKKLKLSPKLELTVGADCKMHPQQDLVKPVINLRYKWDRDNKHIAVVALHQDRMSLERSFRCKVKRVSWRLDTAAELMYSGRPRLGFDIGDVKPWPVVVAAALVTYALNKPLKASKSVGDFKLDLPLRSLSLQSGKVEARLRLQKGQPLHLQQLNAQLML